jgi:hypothetical protein
MSNIYRPASFQGFGRDKNYFEGWYFKLVDKDGNNAFAVIAGISLPGDTEKAHAFVMVLDACNHRMEYFRYPVNDFWADKNKFEIKIGKNFFSALRLQLDCDNGTNSILADIGMRNITPWPVTPLSPGVMGWYRFVPFMECYHANISFNNTLDGHIIWNGSRRDLSGGKGYIEKDWGSSMPQSWIWMQTNHFGTEGVSLLGSIAKIPWLGSYFTGYIFGLLFNNKIFKFTTYNGARVDKLQVTSDNIEIIAENKQCWLEIRAKRTPGLDLPAPKFGDMTSRVNESLSSEIEVKLFKKTVNGREMIFGGAGKNAGLEFVGDIGELLRGFKK